MRTEAAMSQPGLTSGVPSGRTTRIDASQPPDASGRHVGPAKGKSAKRPGLKLRGGPSEAEILRDCLKYLDMLPETHAQRANCGSVKVGGRFIRWNKPGTADILVCYRGRWIGVECKRDGESPTPDQVAWGQSIVEAGGVYLVVHSWMELRDELQEVS